MDWFTAFLASPTGLATKGLLVAAFVVFAFGVFASLRDGSYSGQVVAAFVRSTIWGKVTPVGFLLAISYVANDTLLTTAGIAAAAIVAGQMIASIKASLDQLAMTKTKSVVVNTVPTA